ncbi:MAG: Ig-like domain-containing protein [Mucilaginibacter polytrichastri]|nr:Ig-like domain-containing protein [Mucilaginibacter polytrichastri]
MLQKPVYSFYGFFCVLLLLALFSSRCASVQRPQGGPRDSNPPKLLKATPANLTRNFKAKQIDLEFDEYFKLTNQYQEITMIPEPEKSPEYRVRLKKLEIILNDSLLKNTTYVINFGKAVADVNEGNALRNFTYVFSTGDKIDSLSISGKVFNTVTNKPEKEATVFILPASQDTLPKRKKPNYYTGTDSSGTFKLNNLKEGKYRIYALKEEAANRLYDNDNELIAFDPKPIDLKKDTTGIKLDLFLQEPEKFRVLQKRIDKDGKLFFTFNKPVPNGTIRILTPPDLDQGKTVDFGTKKDTALVYLKSMNFDSLNVAILQNNRPLDTVMVRRNKNDKYTRTQSLTFNLVDDKLKTRTPLRVHATYPLSKIEKGRIILNEDSVEVDNFSIQRDTASLVDFSLNYTWLAGSEYDITFVEGALVDVYGTESKKIDRKFQVDNPNNYGNLALNITLSDTGKSYVIELLNSQKQVIKTDVITKNTVLRYNGYRAGTYQVQITYDLNKDGRWTTGNVQRRTQPEPMYVYPKDITLRPNWDYEEKFTIPDSPPETSRNTSRTEPEASQEEPVAPQTGP